ncbi:hypothetical protein IE077_002290 [Cardiosporidium cionae]|uniref:Uncharacterized protein n=1 Tax=Cardiosporidium cionae TaxID=476202 RepID=A0ABQ7JFS7_9APIC|nr:hypothetical protein IE077_002290 [Cardiosporidium cionae]|eukprot:KAF8822877.1 hypothetical protein IE077_002290 [Cardiosporidium cionae]
MKYSIAYLPLEIVRKCSTIDPNSVVAAAMEHYTDGVSTLEQAAKFLKDSKFVVKYPALSRALRESLDGSESPVSMERFLYRPNKYDSEGFFQQEPAEKESVIVAKKKEVNKNNSAKGYDEENPVIRYICNANSTQNRVLLSTLKDLLTLQSLTLQSFHLLDELQKQYTDGLKLQNLIQKQFNLLKSTDRKAWLTNPAISFEQMDKKAGYGTKDPGASVLPFTKKSELEFLGRNIPRPCYSNEASPVNGRSTLPDTNILKLPNASEMTKPNLFYLQMKQGMDESLQHFKSQSGSLVTKNQELGRKMQGIVDDADVSLLKCTSTNKYLTDLYKEQREYIHDQQRIADQVPRECIESHKRSIRVNHEELNIERQKQQEIAKLSDHRLQETPTFSTHFPTSRRSPLQSITQQTSAGDLTHTKALSFTVDEVLQSVGFNEAAQFVNNCGLPTQYATHFPGIYPVSLYTKKLPINYFKRQRRKVEWEQMNNTVKPQVKKSFSRANDISLLKQQKEIGKAEMYLDELKKKKTEVESKIKGNNLLGLEEKSQQLSMQTYANEFVRGGSQSSLGEKFLASASHLMHRKSLPYDLSRTFTKDLTESSPRSLSEDGSTYDIIRSRTSPIRNRTLTLHKFPSISMPRNVKATAGDAIERIDDFTRIEKPHSLSTSIPPQEGKPGMLSQSDLTKKLPYYRCETFVELALPEEPTCDLPTDGYEKLKKVIQNKNLGLKEHAQLVYNFTYACCRATVRSTPEAQVEHLTVFNCHYARQVLQMSLWSRYYSIHYSKVTNYVLQSLALPNYLSRIYQFHITGSNVQQLLAPLLFNCFTAQLAIDDEALKEDVISGMALIVQPQVILNTRVVDLLIETIENSTNPKLLEYCLQILLVTRSPHRKEDQYKLFIKTLHAWRFEANVVTAMQHQVNDRRIQGAASQALATLVKVSPEHCYRVATVALAHAFRAIEIHPESSSISSNIARIVEVVALYNDHLNLLPEHVDSVVLNIVESNSVSVEAFSACLGTCSALMDNRLPLLKRTFLMKLTQQGCTHSTEASLGLNASRFIATAAMKASRLVAIHPMSEQESFNYLIEFGVVAVPLKTLATCLNDPLSCQAACRAISLLVVRQRSGETRIYRDINNMKGIVTMLFLLLRYKSSALTDLLCEALAAISNCANDKTCAASIGDRGIDTIFQVIKENSASVECVAQGMRLLGIYEREQEDQVSVVPKAMNAIRQLKTNGSDEETKSIKEFLIKVLNLQGIPSQIETRLCAEIV